MILAHYILWRVAGYNGPIMFCYIIGIAAIALGIIEGIDRIAQRIRKRRKDNQL